MFTNAQLSEIPYIISQPRFSTYLKASDNKHDALKLYQWNLEISSAFLIPLHLLEITLRNAVVEAIETVHTTNWPWHHGFTRRLPNPKRGYNQQIELIALAKSMHKHTMGKVVAELKFIFWEKMLTARHDKHIWDHHIKSIFPHAYKNLSHKDIRYTIHDDVKSLRQDLRNRIAHHEPIFSRNLYKDYKKIYRIIRWRSPLTAKWMHDTQKVHSLLKEKPFINI